ncbi:bacteriocin UviB [[Clostridium] sordellii]|uniref:BhlA/UviB family holin-like peptide n=1 Tax=Paraclostridium sordellii TaxID=1505 RepID=UPI000542D3BD|nr:BhlA/UviB family holin-like peptide [Paeniclostridium sordellii]CEK29425.1 bacteriocin UviB [[Clostridium] sordellii] [Paeniclostridium sordellii]
MEKATMDLIVSQGIFAILFLYLFADTRKESKKREEELQKIIDNNQKIIIETVNKLNVIEDVKEDVKEIKNKINGAV